MRSQIFQKTIFIDFIRHKSPLNIPTVLLLFQIIPQQFTLNGRQSMVFMLFQISQVPVIFFRTCNSLSSIINNNIQIRKLCIHPSNHFFHFPNVPKVYPINQQTIGPFRKVIFLTILFRCICRKTSGYKYRCPFTQQGQSDLIPNLYARSRNQHHHSCHSSVPTLKLL